MKITKALRLFLAKTFNMDANATDDQVRELVTAKLFAGELSAEQLAELTKSETAADKLTAIVDERIKAANEPILESLKRLTEAVTKQPAPATGSDADNAAALDRINQAAQAAATKAAANVATSGNAAAGNAAGNAAGAAAPGDDPAHKAMAGVANAAATGEDIRVKSIAEQFDRTRKSLAYPSHTQKGNSHPLAGQPAKGWDGASLDAPSQLDLAVCGAYFKWAVTPQLKRLGVRVPELTDLEKKLVDYALHELPWTGEVNGPTSRALQIHEKLADWQRKDIVDDATSGGLEAAPIVFDEAFIAIPVLYGELAPLVEMITLSRGRRVEGVAFANPTINSGPAEDGTTSISLETTAGFISAVDTTVFNATGAIRVGRDWASDTPIDFGRFIIEAFGFKFMEWLDNQIANGDGATEPQGIFNATGTNLVTSALGPGGPFILGDVESMIFGVSKAYRNAKGGRNVFVGNDTTYRRLRGIPVGQADQRRIFGGDYESYMVAGYPYKVQNDVPSTSLGFVNLAYYRLYRRAGFNISVHTEGQTLALLNEMLFVARARYGGRLTAGAAMAEMNNAPAVDEP